MAQKYRKSSTGKKRGPKKGYKQSAKHRAAISKGQKLAWKAGKFKNRRRRRRSSTEHKPIRSRTSRRVRRPRRD